MFFHPSGKKSEVILYCSKKLKTESVFLKQILLDFCTMISRSRLFHNDEVLPPPRWNITEKISKAALINVLRKEDNKAKYYFLYDGLVFY